MAGLALAVPALLPTPARAIADVHVVTLSGTDNVSAAIAFSERTYSQDAIDEGFRPPSVLLSRDDAFPDALASAPFQTLRGSPLLYTGSATLDPRTSAEIDRLGPAEVLILGGDAAVSPAVADAVAAKGMQVSRISGATRLETAIAIAQRVSALENPQLELAESARAIVARAFDDGPGTDPSRAFVDSIAIGGATQGRPIVLSETAQLSGATDSYLASAGHPSASIVGGTGALSDGVLEAVNGHTNGSAERVSGANRYATAVSLNQRFIGSPDQVTYYGITLVDGTHPQAWAPGFAAAINGPVVLADGDTIPADTAAFLDSFRDWEIPFFLICAPFTTTAACDAAAAILRD